MDIGRWRDALRFSIKARLVLLFLLLALATTAVFVFGTHRLLQTGWEAFAKPLVDDYADRLAAEIGSPPDPARALAMTQRLPISVHIDGPRVQFDSRPPDASRGPWRDHGSAAAFGLQRFTADGHRISFGLTRPPDPLRPRFLGWVTLGLLLLLTALAYGATRRLLAPLSRIGSGVEAYGRGDFGTPIDVGRRDELGRLAERINGMAANLHGMLQAKRELLLAISHELRSPLTRARLNTELLNDSAERRALLRDLAEMRDLLDNLLENERLAQGHAALQAEAVDLPRLVRDAVAASGSGNPGSAIDRTVDLRIDDIGGPLLADPTRLRLLLRNLIDNAWRHAANAPAAARPLVFLQRLDDGRIALGVRDHGAGVSAAQLQRLGQPFYRTDSARTRASGGVGLGLALARSVAEAHGGELRIENAAPGLRVTALWLPQQPPR